MQSEKQTTIAIVDDDHFLLESLRDLLETFGVESRIYNSADAFLVSGDLHRVNCVLADVKMPGTSGLDLLHAVVRQCGPPVCIMTSYTDNRTKAIATSSGAVAFLEKPLNSQDLIDFIAHAADR
ncbi:response regulator transcription factor [Ferirhizobium litorale]|uniref:Response regulator n=1 Tax=Ferirhizobium litorale TaxID=2927786 RepID=A0AAE3QJT1_9HYPH|nr:response regulator [Fererhizobium litorale]MDI7925215.1 response regulator [Fererhizobium litorale]